MAYISKGLTLEFAKDNPRRGAMSAYWQTLVTAGKAEADSKMILPGLQEVGALTIVGAASGSYDQIEVTTLADSKHQYVDGLMTDADNGDNTIDFKFLYDPDLFQAFVGTASLDGSANFDTYNTWIVEIPEGGQFHLVATIASVNMDSVSTNSALTFVATLKIHEISYQRNNA